MEELSKILLQILLSKICWRKEIRLPKISRNKSNLLLNIGESILIKFSLKVYIDILYVDFGISQDVERELVSAAVAHRNAESKIINAKGDV